MNPQAETSATPLGKTAPLYQRPVFLLVCWALLILVLSIRPAGQMRILLFPYADKVIHAVFYLPLGFLALSVLSEQERFRGGFSLPLTVTLLCGGYGFLIEVIQHFLPTRSFEFLDGLADMIGACLGALLALRWIPNFLRAAR